MKTAIRLRHLILCPGLSLVMFFAAPGVRAQAPAQNDATIQNNVVNALTQAPRLQGQQITAATIQGSVTISGVVKDETTKELAQKIAASVSGVRSVENNLTIGDPNAQTADQNDAQNEAEAGRSQQAQDRQSQSGRPQNQGVPEVRQPATPNAPPSAQSPDMASRPAYSPQQGSYAPPPPRQNGAYPPPPAQHTQNTIGPVIVPAGTLLRVRISEPLDTKGLQAGAMFEATAASDLFENGVLAIPRGAAVDGQVVEAKNAGPFGGSAKLQLKLSTLNLAGRVYPLASDTWSNQSPSKNGYTARNTAGGAVIGALLGAALGGGTGAAFGAVAGGTAGATASAATSGPRLALPPETLLVFHLSAPVTVQPVSSDEAERLASSAPRQPVVQRRPVYVERPYPYPYYYGPAYYRYGW